MTRATRLAGLAVMTAMLGAPALARADEYDDAVPLAPLPGAKPAPDAKPADTTGAVDTVQLRSGGTFRGRVTEILPNSHVSIAVPGEGTKRFAWADVEKVVVASYAGPLPPSGAGATPYVAPSTPPIEAPMQGPRARVHLRAKSRVLLYRKPAGTNAWTQACASPCDVELPIGDSYRLTGNGVPQTREFRLEASPGGAVEIEFDPPSTPGILLGGTMAYGGAGAAYVGLLVTLASLGNSYEKDTRDAGLVTMAVGAGIGALGLVVFLNSSTTDIEQRSGGRAAAAAGGRLDAFVRSPSWKGAAPSEVAAVAPGATFPLVLTKAF